MPSKSYINPEASTTWADTGGDKLLDLGGATSSAPVMGAYKDLGVAPRADMYEVEFFIDELQATPTVGEVIDLYFSQSKDGTTFDGEPTTAPTTSAQGTITSAQLSNLLYVGSLVVISVTGSDNNLRGRFVTRLTSRYVSPVVMNRSHEALKAASDAHRVILTPIPQEGQ